MTELAADGVANQAENGADTLVLDSTLPAMASLPPWVDSVAERHSIPEKTRFAVKLCLEEAVSNSIRHGYRELPGSQVRVRFRNTSGQGWTFIVEDDAPRFNPLERPKAPPLTVAALDASFALGGQGIRLMREFASSIDYEETPTGNRVMIAFAPPPEQVDNPVDSSSA
jgi:anti-sigma regulatory factor (Ser/Thr protein kinase)